MIKAYRTMLELLTVEERKRFYIMAILLTIASLLEVASLGAVLPLLSVLSQGQAAVATGPLHYIYEYFNFESLQTFQIFLSITVMAIVLAGVFLKILSHYAQVRFSAMRGFSISSRLLQGYLHRSYLALSQKHSADVSKYVLAEIQNLTDGFLLPIAQFIAGVTLTCFIVALVFFVEPVAALGGALIVGMAYVLIFIAVRKYLFEIGRRLLAANHNRFQVVQEALGGVKYMKLRHLEEYFVRMFNIPAREYGERYAQREVITKIPRFLLESVAFGTMIIFILFLLARNNGDIQSSIPILGVFAFAGIRLLPAMQSIYSAVALVKSNTPLANEIAHELKESGKSLDRWIREKPKRKRLLTDTLVLKDIGFRYPGNENMALENLNLTIKAGEVVGIVGGTGAGKTTIADILLGLIEPSQGEILVDNQSIDDDLRPIWKQGIGYVPQSIFLTDDTVARNIAFGVADKDIEIDRIRNAAKIAALDEFVSAELPDKYDSYVGEGGVRLSGGQRQRIGIARALYNDPDILLLDEATSALDNLTEHAVMEAIHNMGSHKTIIMIAHRLSTLKACDRIFFLQGGRVVAEGNFETLLASNSDFRNMAHAGASA